MRRGAAMIPMLALMLVLPACATRDVKPSAAEMDRVEAALRKIPCVGDVGAWSRSYFYHAKYFGDEVAAAAREQRAPLASGHVRTQISFALQQASDESFVAGRVSFAAPPPGVNSAGSDGSAGLRRAMGSYDLRDGRLNIAGCDPARP